MKIRLVVAVLVAGAVAVTGPAGAAGTATSTLYLSQTGACDSPSWSLVPEESDSHECSYIPRLLVQGTGVDTTSESFAMSKKTTLGLDSSRKVTGTFTITTPGPVSAEGVPVGAEVVGLAGAEFTIKVGKVRVGSVHVEGPVAPTKPATAAFSLDVPKSLHNVQTNLVTVDVVWTTCVGAVGCAVRVGGDSHSHLVLPTK